MSKRLDKGNKELAFDILISKIIVVILGVAPLFRGLFFSQDQYNFYLILAPIFLVTLVHTLIKRSWNLSRPTWGLIIVLIAYIATIPTSVNKGYAVQELLKWITCFLLFLSVSQLAQNKKIEKIFLWGVHLSGVLVAITSLASACKLFTYKDVFSGNRLDGVFQYANTTAIYLAASFLVGTYLLLELFLSKGGFTYRKTLTVALACSSTLLTVAIGATRSNGGLIVLLMVIGIWGLLNKGQSRYIIYSITLLELVAGIGFGRYITNLLQDGHNIYALLICFIPGAIISPVLLYLQIKLRSCTFEQAEPIKNIGLIAVSFGMFIMALTVVLSGVGGIDKYLMLKDQVLPQLRLHNLVARILFFRDALHMIIQKPVLGWGGGGWAEAYQSIRSFGYISRQVHSSFLQLTVETGLIGLLGFISFIVLTFKSWAVKVKSNESDPNYQQFILVTGLAAMALLLHSAVDFDFSLSAVVMEFLVLTAIISTPSHDNKKVKMTNIIGWSAIVLCLLLFISAAMFSISAKEAESAIYSKDLQLRGSYALKAAKYNPIDSTNHIILAQTYFALGNNEQARIEAEKAVSLSQYNIQSRMILVNIALKEKDHQKAVTQIQEAVKLDQLNPAAYEALSSVLLKAAYLSKDQGQLNKSLEYLKQQQAIPGRLKQLRSQLSEPELKLSKIKLQVSRELEDSLKEGKKLQTEIIKNKVEK